MAISEGKVFDLVQEITRTSGQAGIIFLEKINGYGTFLDAMPGGGKVRYAIRSSLDSEIGVGIVSSQGRLFRPSKPDITIIAGDYKNPATERIHLTGTSIVTIAPSAILIEELKDEARTIKSQLDAGLLVNEILHYTNEKGIVSTNKKYAEDDVSFTTGGVGLIRDVLSAVVPSSKEQLLIVTKFFTNGSSDGKLYYYGVGSNFSYTPTRSTNLHSSNTRPVGLAQEGIYIYVGDAAAKKIFVYDINDGTYVSSIGDAYTLNSDIGGLWVSRSILYVLNSVNVLEAYPASSKTYTPSNNITLPKTFGKERIFDFWIDTILGLAYVVVNDGNIYALNLSDNSLNLNRSFHGKGGTGDINRFISVSANSEYIYVVLSGVKEILAFSSELDTQQRLINKIQDNNKFGLRIKDKGFQSNTAATDTIKCLAGDNGKNIFIIINRKIFVYSKTTGLIKSSHALNNTTLNPGNTDPTGASVVGSLLYVVDYTDKRTYNYPLDGTASASGSDFILTDMRAPVGISVSSSGTTVMFVSSSSQDKKVFFYNLTDKSLLNSFIALDPLNINSRAITYGYIKNFNGPIVFVSNVNYSGITDNLKIFAYKQSSGERLPQYDIDLSHKTSDIYMQRTPSITHASTEDIFILDKKKVGNNTMVARHARMTQVEYLWQQQL